MKKTTLTIMLMSLACVVSATGADISSNISLDGNYVDIRSANKYKATEYQDLGTGVRGKFDLDANSSGYYLNLLGDGFGYNTSNDGWYQDSQVSLKGGKYESFKYSLFFNQIPHNLTYGAKTVYSGINTNLLTYIGPNPATTTQYTTTFDYGIDRTNYGIAFEGSFKTPFFFSVKADRTDMSGLMPLGVTTSAVEVPAPISSSTENLYIETGYRSKELIISIDGTLNNFYNDNQYFYINLMPASAVNQLTSPFTLAPDNNYYKIGGSLTAKLPFNSTFMGRTSFAKLDSDIALPYLNAASLANYNADVRYTTVATSLVSNPIKPLDVRIYYNYLDRENHSTPNAQLGSSSAVVTDKFAYDKQDIGMDIGYRLPAKTKLTVGYEYLELNRNSRRFVAKTNDNIIFAEVKNSLIDSITAKIRYQHMFRSGQVSYMDTANSATPTSFDSATQVTPFYVADTSQDTVKFGLEVEPLQNLSLGLDYILKRNKYNDTDLGVTKDIRHEIYLDANYALSIMKLNAYYDFETVERNELTKASAYTWTSRRTDNNFAYGINANFDIIKNKLTAGASWRYEKANGNNEFSATSGLAVTPVTITQLDDYTRKAITAKLDYKINNNLNVCCSYSYDTLRYSDAELNNYQYITAGNSAYLTGAYANPDYTAHIGFVKLGYTF